MDTFSTHLICVFRVADARRVNDALTIESMRIIEWRMQMELIEERLSPECDVVVLAREGELEKHLKVSNDSRRMNAGAGLPESRLVYLVTICC